ncbi:NAD(P)-binding protein [Oribacterium sp. WCC10]|uniref:NAD(P)-binding protein n=1 Tax=Oribacterium sp. WCC10 TaxID=1855343 RepID=UPI0008E32C0B|nr:NAD(P)-binding protein [Oribacterium sp. WCC10]SFG63607.1 NADPH-dependent glutamate synthase beta chain [Oribacterium sp. WCC10]
MRALSKKGNINDRTDTVLRKFKTMMTSYPPGLCPLTLYRSLLQISMNQSCGKCVPCRDGLSEVDAILKSIIDGDASQDALSEIENKCRMIAKTADCAVGIMGAKLILDSLSEFPDEYESHIKNRRCLQSSQTIPCVTLCPAHVDVPAYIAMIKAGDYEGAVKVIRNRNPFPTACAMVCEHPCERKCRRTFIDAPINIRGLKKYAVDMVSADKVSVPAKNVKTGRKIAVVGGGPSGLTSAYFLALMGHEVHVYEEHEKLGGMLRYGIPEYRLPKERLDEDIRAILRAGDIEIHSGTKIGIDIRIEELRQDFDAVYLGIGAQIGNRMPVEGADAKNVIPAADFLQAVARGENIDLRGKKVVLIGGGNVAMDAARTAARLNAETIHVFTRKRDDYTALPSEIEAAMQEGVRFRTLLSFLNIETDKESNEVRAVWLQPEIVAEYDKFGMMTTEHSSNYPYRFKCDLLILGVGQRSDTESFQASGVPVERGRIKADEFCRVEGMDNVFSGGDCVTGPSTAINAIAAGQVAAYNIDEYLGYHHKISLDVSVPDAMPSTCTPTGRAEIEERDPFERRADFEFVELPMTHEEAMREAGRCLRCDHFGCGAMEGGRGE